MLEILRVGIIILAILDPFLATPPFLAMTKKLKFEERNKVIFDGVCIAGVIMFIFLICGIEILNLFTISLPSFKIAGGIVLFILGVQLALGQEVIKEKKKSKEKTAVALLLGTPLLAGPAAITTIIIVSQEYGILTSFFGLLFALGVVYVILTFGNIIIKYLGERGIETISRMMGLILAAYAIEFIRSGILTIG